MYSHNHEIEKMDALHGAADMIEEFDINAVQLAIVIDPDTKGITGLVTTDSFINFIKGKDAYVT